MNISFFLCITLLALSSCQNLDEIEARLDKLETKVSGNESIIKALQDAYKDGKIIKSVTPLQGDYDGWLILFSDGSSIKVINGSNGKDGIYVVDILEYYETFEFIFSDGSTICCRKNTIYTSSQIYKLYNYHKILFCGDSVTEGHVIEGNLDNPNSLNAVLPDYSYPMQFQRMYPGIDVDVKARAGISPVGWLQQYCDAIDFSFYDMIVIELGYNGGIYVNEIDQNGTNTNAYHNIVKCVRENNKNAEIILVRSSYSPVDWIPVLEEISKRFQCRTIDLRDEKYLNLNDLKYHGYVISSDGQLNMDYVHFTRKGYNAKAYVVSHLIEDVLTDETIY